MCGVWRLTARLNWSFGGRGILLSGSVYTGSGGVFVTFDGTFSVVKSL
jgi:hypothetical protein